jgi:di/tricarboxylate transporter
MEPVAFTSAMVAPGLVGGAAILLWASALLPEYLVALLFFAAAMLLRVAPPEVVFSGFLSQAFWLVLSGFVLGAAIREVGLADRVAAMLAGALTRSWPRMVAGVVALTYGLAFVMPSNMGRITLLMPIVMALADSAGLPRGGRGRIGLALAVGAGTFELSASILPANVPNLVMTGTAERAFGVHFAYLSYLALHGPVLGLLKAGLLIGCIVALFPDDPRPVTARGGATIRDPRQMRLAALLVVTLALWMTDSIHGIPPAWIGLGAACLCLSPGIGFLTGEDFAAGVNTRICLYLAGILGFAAVVAACGLGALLGRAVLSVLPLDPAKPALDFASLIGLTGLLNFAITANGVPALFTPLARGLADASGFSLPTVLMIQVIGYATPLLPYQSAPIVVAMGLGGVPARDGMKLCLLLGALSFVLLTPVDYAWFRLLGWIG